MKYRYIRNQKHFYNYLSSLQNKGYKIIKHYFLAYLLAKENEEILVSPFKIKDVNNIQKELERYVHNYAITKPDYSNTNLNIIAGIRNNFGYSFEYKIDDKIFDRKYEYAILLLLDGLGKNVLENNLPEDAFLRKNCFKYVNSIFPSTTACATTAIKSGRAPIETAWTGWHNYFKEINKDIILFCGINYYDRKDRNNPKAYDLIAFKCFFEDMGMGSVVEPDFSNIDFDDTLKRSIENIENDKVQYVYHTEPDECMHRHGTYSKQVKKVLAILDKKVSDYANKLPNNTLLVIIADHGHIPVYKGIPFYLNKEINQMLITRPSNDTRCQVFRVKEEYKNIFKDTFDLYYEDIYDLYETAYLIDNGFFGDKKKAHPKIKDLLGDYIAIAKSDYMLYSKKDFNFKSHHAGYTSEEMIVPIIVYKK